MHNKIKTLIGLLVFVIFIAGAYFAYNSLSNKIKPDTCATLKGYLEKIEH